MPKIEQKEAIVREIKSKLENASSIVIVDARGLTVAQDTDLRRKFRAEGVEYKVYKNSMVRFAVKDTKFSELTDYLAGPSAFAISYSDPVAGARLISKELKDKKALQFKAGFVEGTVYDAAGIHAVADIPSRETLIARLLGSFKSPSAAFARVIKAIAEKDSPAEAASEAESA
ncbi:MAG: 50S ribosomal protein L10 [Clostridiales bacterium]|jgi:large subunit ribosomal protein L10|nr:50S ribosomal protein L10 [Clostridiales bacterium]